MSFIPPSHTVAGITYDWIPERVLAYGGYGVGKTQAWLSIADLYFKTDTPGTFHVADADDAVLRSMSGQYDHLTNVKVTPVIYFTDYAKWAIGLKDEVQKGDWIVADTASSAYSAATEHYLSKMYGKTRSDFELERLLDPEHKGPPIEPGDWVQIRGLFLSWWENLVVRDLSTAKLCHLFATAEPKQVLDHFEGKSKDKSVLQDYGALGWRPEGHKSFPHKAHSVLMFARTGNGEDGFKYWVQTVKDRSARDTKNLRLDNGFAMDYLMGRAGWKLT